MPPGFLAVFSEPGANVTVEEFQDWYDNEHIPIRLNHIPSFLTGARYSASDSLRPSWVALYDVDDTAIFEREIYTRLRANRSPREADLVKRLEILDRRTYEMIGDVDSGFTSSYHPKNPTKFILTQGIECASDAQLNGWLDATMEDLKKVEGWTRTRMYKCIDNLKSGMGVGINKEEQEVPAYLMIHEFLHPAASDSFPFKSCLQRHSERFGVQFVSGDERKWGLYRAYPCIAQTQQYSSHVG